MKDYLVKINNLQ
jgi:V-type H+-transporting ATPase subunit a